MCNAHGLLYPVQTPGSWETTPMTTELRCKVADDAAATFLYRALLRLAAAQGVNISELTVSGIIFEQ
jgi:cobyrinic acid a,c-diamide synthase